MVRYTRARPVETWNDGSCLPPQNTIVIGPHTILQMCRLYGYFASLLGHLQWAHNQAL